MIDVRKVASLARLTMTDEELDQNQKKMTAILGHFEKIRAINTDDVEPLVTPSDIELVIREDNMIHEITPEDAIRNAPEKMGSLFRVPPVVG